VWSFGSNIHPHPGRNREAAARALPAAPALPESEMTDVPQQPISAAAQNGNSEVAADEEEGEMISSTQPPSNSPAWPAGKAGGGGG